MLTSRKGNYTATKIMLKIHRQNVPQITLRTLATSGVYGLLWINRFSITNDYYSGRAAILWIAAYSALVGLAVSYNVIGLSENNLDLFNVAFFSMILLALSTYVVAIFLSIKITRELNALLDRSHNTTIKRRSLVRALLSTVFGFLVASYLQTYINEICESEGADYVVR